MHSPRGLALAGTLDEYGDIRSRPHGEQQQQHSRRNAAISHGSGHAHYSHGRTSSPPELGSENQFLSREHTSLGGHDFETDMFQWPFIDATWSTGFDSGLDGLWHNSGLFDMNPSMR